MKVTIELDTPGEGRCYLLAPSLYAVLWDIVHGDMRRWFTKAEHDFSSADEALQAVWDGIHDILKFHSIDLDAMEWS